MTARESLTITKKRKKQMRFDFIFRLFVVVVFCVIQHPATDLLRVR
jgi:hypothetical protein